MKKIVIILCCLAAAAILPGQLRAQENIIDRDLTGTTFKDAEKELGLVEKMLVMDSGTDLTMAAYYRKDGNWLLASDAKLLLLSERAADGSYTILEDVKIDRSPGYNFAMWNLVDTATGKNRFETFCTFKMNGDNLVIKEMYYVEYQDSKFTIEKPAPGSNWEEYQP